MQFLDRVTQILQHIASDQLRMHEHLRGVQDAIKNGEPMPMIDINAWLAQLQKTYTTVEQSAVHSGKSSAAAPASDGDVDFF
jgi:methyl-accepting chemotaxis protein